jgi:hypothetical protein
MGHTPYVRYVYLDFASEEVSRFEKECQYNLKDQLDGSFREHCGRFPTAG